MECDLAGVTELGDILGVSRQRAAQLAEANQVSLRRSQTWRQAGSGGCRTRCCGRKLGGEVAGLGVASGLSMWATGMTGGTAAALCRCGSYVSMNHVSIGQPGELVGEQRARAGPPEQPAQDTSNWTADNGRSEHLSRVTWSRSRPKRPVRLHSQGFLASAFLSQTRSSPLGKLSVASITSTTCRSPWGLRPRPWTRPERSWSSPGPEPLTTPNSRNPVLDSIGLELDAEAELTKRVARSHPLTGLDGGTVPRRRVLPPPPRALQESTNSLNTVRLALGAMGAACSPWEFLPKWRRRRFLMPLGTVAQSGLT